MKKYAKKATALAMAAAMAVMATPVYASAPSNQTSTNVADTSTDTVVEGQSTIVNPIYKVTLPTAIPFAIDAFELQGSALSSKSFAIVNRSNVPVAITATVSVAAADGVDLKVPTATSGVVTSGVTQDAETKEAAVWLQLGTTNTGTLTSVLTQPEWDYGAGANVALEMLDTATPAELFFLLEGGYYPLDANGVMSKTIDATNGVDPAVNAAGFKIVGDVTTYPQTEDGEAAAWLAGDVTVSATFKIEGKRTSDFFAYTNQASSAGSTPVANAQNTYSTLTENPAGAPDAAEGTDITPAAGTIQVAEGADGESLDITTGSGTATYYYRVGAKGATVKDGSDLMLKQGLSGTGFKPASTTASGVVNEAVEAGAYFVEFVSVNARGQITGWGTSAQITVAP